MSSPEFNGYGTMGYQRGQRDSQANPPPRQEMLRAAKLPCLNCGSDLMKTVTQEDKCAHCGSPI
jgi:hypothetical protein